jgi:hypothetical protein
LGNSSFVDGWSPRLPLETSPQCRAETTLPGQSVALRRALRGVVPDQPAERDVRIAELKARLRRHEWMFSLL